MEHVTQQALKKVREQKVKDQKEAQRAAEAEFFRTEVERLSKLSLDELDQLDSQKQKAAQEAARLAAAKKEEQTQAINLFKEMFEKWINRLYTEPDAEILRQGRLIREIGPGAITFPNAFLKLWRDKRYKAKGMEPVNYSMMPGQQWIAQGNEADGWPKLDEADEEARRIIDVEWRQFINFCKRFADRVEPVC